MKLTIDSDIILPTLTGIIAILIVIVSQLMVPRSSVEYFMSESDNLFAEVSIANHEIDVLTHELETYRATEAYICSMGATPNQARIIIKASETLDVSPKS